MADAIPVHATKPAGKKPAPKADKKPVEVQPPANPEPGTTYKLPDGTVVTQN